MKQVYPTFIVNTNDGSEHPFLVCVPDMEILTEGILLQMLLKWQEMLSDWQESRWRIMAKSFQPHRTKGML